MSINYLRTQQRTIQQQLQQTAPTSSEFQQLRNQRLVVQAQLAQAQGSIRGLTF